MKLESNRGYEEEASALLDQYERLSFKECHHRILDLVPQSPGVILDIGAGTGRDAGYLAGMGHRLVAVEPTDALRNAAIRFHPSRNIEWIEDSLPDLKKIMMRTKEFDLIMITAVWMHLDLAERQRAMPVVASLLKDDGLLIMNLRHGPVPQGRRMFEISDSEMIELARKRNLTAIRQEHGESILKRNPLDGVTWSQFAFQKIQAAASNIS